MRRIAALFCTLGLGVALPAIPAAAAPTPLPGSTVLVVPGHGWGHARGMGQWGAKGMADGGATYVEILRHYYSGVTIGTRADEWLRVLVEASPDVVVFSPSPFAIWFDAATDEQLATSSDTFPFWKVTYTGSAHRLWKAGWNNAHSGPGSWTAVATDDRYVTFRPGDSQLELVFGNTTVRRYHGSITARYASSDGVRAINTVRMQDYLRGVVPRESPSGWPLPSLKAQAVAARTYATRKRDDSRSRGTTFDICATTQCQVYGGSGQRARPGGSMIGLEADSTNTAIDQTLGEVLTYGGAPILAEYSSSTGGYTAPGTVPYQKAVPDPGDQVSPHHDWTAQMTVAEIERQWPDVGRLVDLEVTSRNGYGDWGGRVRQLRLVGTSSTVSVSGDEFRGAFSWPSRGSGVRSSWFAIGIWRSVRVLTPTSRTLPTGSVASLAYRFRNTGTESWPVGDAISFETDAGSPFRASSWPSATAVAPLGRNVTRPDAGMVAEDEVGELTVALDATDVAPGTYEVPLRLVAFGATVLDTVRLQVTVVPSWIERAPSLLSGSSFERGLTGWRSGGAAAPTTDGRDLTGGAAFTGSGSLSQIVDLAGGTARRFHWGAWTRSAGSSLRVRAFVRYLDGRAHTKQLTIPSGAHAWTYTEAGFDTLADVGVDRITVVVNSAGPGTAIDALRLVEDPLQNPSFEQGMAGWTRVAAPATGSQVGTTSAYATPVASDGDQSLVFPGRDEQMTIEQAVPFVAAAWDRFELRLDHRTYGTDAAGGAWTGRVTLTHPGGETTEVPFDLPVAQHPWQTTVVPFASTSLVTSATLRLGVANQTGRLYLDAVRLLRSRGADPSFEQPATAWNVSALQADDGFAAWAARDGARGLRMTGTDRAVLTQTFELNGDASRVLRLAGFSASTGSRAHRIAVTFFHLDGSRSTGIVSFGQYGHPWRYAEELVSSPEPFDRVRLGAVAEPSRGAVSFDQITLIDA